MKQFGKLLAAFVVLASSAFAQTSTWNIDTAHSAAQFTVRHMGISNVNGTFTKTSGTAQLDEKDITKSSVDATIDATSVDTREPNRDADLKSDHFFDVAKFPTLTFKSKKIVKNGDKLSVIGDLTIRGVTREVTLDSDGLTPAVAIPGATRDVVFRPRRRSTVRISGLNGRALLRAANSWSPTRSRFPWILSW